MSYLRRLSTRSLIVLVVAVVALAGGGARSPSPPAAVARRRRRSRSTRRSTTRSPPRARTASPRASTFTNKLFPSGALLGQVGSALISGASGRLWVTNDGRGRIELQSDAGDVQIVWNPTTITVYDASSNTVYRATLPANASTRARPTRTRRRPSRRSTTFLADLGVHWAVSAASPVDVAGQPAYSVTRLAEARRRPARLGRARVGRGPRHAAARRRSTRRARSSPALELAVTDISYGAVPASDVDVAPPAGAKVVDLGSPSRAATKATSTPAVTGLAAVQPRLPTSRSSRPTRSSACRAGTCGSSVVDTALVALRAGARWDRVVERKADTASPSGRAVQPADASRSTASPRTSSRRSSAPCSSGSRAARPTSSRGRCRRPRPRRPRGR